MRRSIEDLRIFYGEPAGSLARRLLATAVQEADAGRMLLEVSADNPDALGFYAAEGFTAIGRRARYYRDGSDAVVMERAVPGKVRPA